jgi:UDP-glucose 4-epimerase
MRRSGDDAGKEVQMSEGAVVLVTGVARPWGRRLALRLACEPAYRVLGLDEQPPDRILPGCDFIQADVRNPLLGELLGSEGVEVVCHLAFVQADRPSRVSFDYNVQGTRNVLAASAAAGVRQVVLKSSTEVYGARPANPAFLDEGCSLWGSRASGWIRDLIEMEKLCDDAQHETPELAITRLRFASIVGPRADTPMARYLRQPWAPQLLGFDPRMQFVHEEDVIGALLHAVHTGRPGAFNIAAEDVLPFNRVRGLAGKPPLPILHPIVYWRRRLVPLGDLLPGWCMPLEPDYLRYAWVADLSKMRAEFGFEPRYSAEQALCELAEQRRLGGSLSGSPALARDAEQLRAVLARRGREALRERRPAGEPVRGGRNE